VVQALWQVCGGDLVTVTNPSDMPPVVTSHRSGRRKPCSRDGCPRSGQSDGFCSKMCRTLNAEFDRLEELYSTAGDPSLPRDAWLALCSISDDWTAYSNTRALLHRTIRELDLPMP
jgi:hypothetical protein